MLYGYPKEMFVESNTTKHKHKGWFYDHITKKFYRWDDLMDLYQQQKEETLRKRYPDWSRLLKESI